MGAVVSSSHPQTSVPISSQNYTKNATISGAKSLPFGKSQQRNNVWRQKWLNTLISHHWGRFNCYKVEVLCSLLWIGSAVQNTEDGFKGERQRKDSSNAHTNMRMIGMFKCQFFCKNLRFSNSDIPVAYNKQVIGKRLHTLTQWSQRT